jgi:exodeoxyribonuclease-3
MQIELKKQDNDDKLNVLSGNINETKIISSVIKKQNNDNTSAVCTKVSNLRKEGYENFKEWLKDDNNIYVGRRGRMFVNKEIFHFTGSKWSNPYKVSEDHYSLYESIILYKQHLITSGLIYNLEELRGKKLGCFCDQTQICHAQVLVDILEKEKKEDDTIKILSWNVNGIRSNVLSEGKLSSSGWKKELTGETDLGRLIKDHNPDVICLQETKTEDKISKNIKIPNYYQYWSNSLKKKGYAGVSVWTKIETKKVMNIIPNVELDTDSSGRILVLYFDNFILINTYSPNSGTNFTYRTEEWDVEIRKYLRKLKEEGKNVIWCGDLNVSVEDIDVHKGVDENVAGFTKEERSNFKEILKEGYVDTMRYLNPEVKGLYTWWNLRVPTCRVRNIGMRLDYFVVSENIVKKVKKCEILKDYGMKTEEKMALSDHAPIMLTIDKM